MSKKSEGVTQQIFYRCNEEHHYRVTESDVSTSLYTLFEDLSVLNTPAQSNIYKKTEMQIDVSSRFSEMILMHQKAFSKSEFKIYEEPIDIGRGKYRLVLLKGFPVICKKEKELDLSIENFQVQTNKFRLYIIRHQSLISLLGWAQYENSLYYVYKYYDTPIEHYLDTNEVNVEVFKRISQNIFWGAMFLNSRLFFISSSTLYIKNEIPVFGEKIKNLNTLIKNELNEGQSYEKLLKTLMERYKMQNQLLINIFSKFEIHQALKRESIKIIKHIEQFDKELLQGFENAHKTKSYTSVKENIEEFNLSSSYLNKIVEEYYLGPYFEDN